MEAAGVYPIARSTKRILLQQRSKNINNPLKWTNWGGGADKGESALQTAKREFKEESFYNGKLDYYKSYVRNTDTVKFSNFIGLSDEEFKPRVKVKTKDGEVEVNDYKWVTLEEFKNMRGKMIPAIQKDFNKIYKELEKFINKI